MAQTRRDFLKTSAMGVTVSFLAPSFFTGSAYGATVSGNRVLVVFQLNGGNDCVNTIIPYSDSRYRSMRPTLGIPDDQILKLDDRIGFHPSMPELRDLYQQRRFAFVNNVGFNTLDRSHFRCRDVWQTAIDAYGQAPGSSTGWLGRYADLYLPQVDSPVTTVTIGNQNALGLEAGDVLATTLPSADGFDVQTNPLYPEDRASYLAAIRSIYTGQAIDGEGELIRQQGEETFGAIDLIKTIPPPSATAPYPDTAVGRAFGLAAQIIDADLGTHAIWISAGGYDTHSQQPETHAALLADMSQAFGAFDGDIAERGLSDRVMVLGWSEFGRRVQENASLGTDHGKAGTVFLMGSRIRGGTFYGDVPDLEDLDSGDLRTKVDFRSVYSTIIRDWFGNDPEPVLNGTYENLAFVEKDVSRRRLIRR